jgi:hypothetical protein
MHRDCLEKERWHIPPNTAAAGMLRKRCRRSRNEHPNAQLEGCSHKPSQNHMCPLRQRSKARLITTPRGSGKYKRTQASKNKIKTRNRSVGSGSIVNSDTLDMIRALTVVQQIMAEFKGAVSEEAMIFAITKIVINLMKENGK